MTVSPRNNMDVKRQNRVNTLRCILASERVSQMELTHRLALSWPTILQNVKELMELGLVREDGVYASTGGRKAKAYVPVRDAKVAVGVELARDHVSVVMTDLSGKLLRQARGAFRFSQEDIYFKYLSGLVQRFVETDGAADRVLGVGFALPGVVDEERGLLRDSRSLGLRNFPLSTQRPQLRRPGGVPSPARRGRYGLSLFGGQHWGRNFAGWPPLYGGPAPGGGVWTQYADS